MFSIWASRFGVCCLIVGGSGLFSNGTGRLSVGGSGLFSIGASRFGVCCLIVGGSGLFSNGTGYYGEIR